MNILDLDARWRRFNDPDYRCSCCGRTMPGVYDLGFDHPDSWPHGHLADTDGDELQVGDDKLSPELCRYGDHRFIKAILTLPIRGSDDAINLAVWASLTPENFYAYLDHCFDGAEFAGCEAWLMNDLPGFEGDPIACALTPGPDDQRPALTAKDGPLQAAQTNGISFDDLLEIYADFDDDLRPHLNG
jgi:hypothetical protein